MRSKTGRSIAVSTLVIVAMAVGLGGPAVASYDASCSTGDICLWKHSDFGVPLAATPLDDTTYGNNTYPNTQDPLNDSASSVRNRNTKNVIFYFDVNWSGTSFCLPSGLQASTLGSHNDKYSSHLKITPACP